MKRTAILLLLILTACAPHTAPAPDPVATDIPVVQPTTAPGLTAPQISPQASNVDILANLPEPDCSNGLTPSNQEGPYYKADTPERNLLLEENMQGTKLILVGYVLTSDCFTIPGAWLDFWQANASGEYDNSGYTLRGHQFTDNKGRYYLETILPGLYESRPIEHIHVKAQIPNGQVFTTQLYFPTQPVEGLTVELQDMGEYVIGYFNFVLAE